MAEKNNATCSICGKGYHVCLSCRDSMALSPWLVHTDTSAHYKIYQIIRGYSTKMYTKEEARERLKNVNLSDLNTFNKNIKDKIKDIMKEPVVEIVEEEQVEPLVTEEVSVTKKTTASRKRNYKIEEVE